MTTGLKTTVLVSSGLAALLNVVQIASSYHQPAKTAFEPNWADAAQVSKAPAPAHQAVTLTAAVLPSDAPDAAPASQTPPFAGTAASTTPVTVAIAQAKLSAAGLKPVYAANYLDVQAKTGTPWQLLAAVHETETGQSGDTARKSSAGATGPMQFMPATFAHYALDGDGNGTKDITDFDDALLTAGRYLAAGGADKGKYSNALFNYNHSNVYVTKVLSIAHRLGL